MNWPTSLQWIIVHSFLFFESEWIHSEQLKSRQIIQEHCDYKKQNIFKSDGCCYLRIDDASNTKTAWKEWNRVKTSLIERNVVVVRRRQLCYTVSIMLPEIPEHMSVHMHIYTRERERKILKKSQLMSKVYQQHAENNFQVNTFLEKAYSWVHQMKMLSKELHR